MKKFRFSLDSVLSYKQQILDALQGEHGAIVAQVRAQEETISQCWEAYRAYNADYQERARRGMAMTDALYCQSRLRAMEREIQQETEKLEALRRKEEAKRAEVVEAKKESTSIEKLRAKKLDDYHKAEAKSEERFIEDFVNMARIVNSTGA